MRIGFCFGNPAGSGADELAFFLGNHTCNHFEPVIVGSELLYTAALSRICPHLIDRFPVYTLPSGMIIKGEPSFDAGEDQAKAVLTGCKLLALRKIDLLAVNGFSEQAAALYDPQHPSLVSLLSKTFPSASLSRSFFLSPKAVTLYEGLPGRVFEGDYQSIINSIIIE